MKNKIEKAIKTTLVIENKKGIPYTIKAIEQMKKMDIQNIVGAIEIEKK